MKDKPNNSYTRKIREKVTHMRTGEYGEWDAMRIDQRRFLLDAADYMQSATYEADRMQLVKLCVELDDDHVRGAFSIIYAIMQKRSDCERKRDYPEMINKLRNAAAFASSGTVLSPEDCLEIADSMEKLFEECGEMKKTLEKNKENDPCAHCLSSLAECAHCGMR